MANEITVQTSEDIRAAALAKYAPPVFQKGDACSVYVQGQYLLAEVQNGRQDLESGEWSYEVKVWNEVDGDGPVKPVDASDYSQPPSFYLTVGGLAWGERRPSVFPAHFARARFDRPL